MQWLSSLLSSPPVEATVFSGEAPDKVRILVIGDRFAAVAHGFNTIQWQVRRKADQ